MHAKIRERFIRTIIKLPPVEWPRALFRFQKRHKFTAGDMGDLSRSMDDECERLAFLTAYVARRFGCNGCGTKTPRTAVGYAQRKQGRVAAVLGYNAKYRRPFGGTFDSYPGWDEIESGQWQ